MFYDVNMEFWIKWMIYLRILSEDRVACCILFCPEHGMAAVGKIKKIGISPVFWRVKNALCN